MQLVALNHHVRRAFGAVLAAVLMTTGVIALDVQPAAAAYAFPPTTRGLPAAIEYAQPYIGQTTCDPVAKPGVVAFRNVLLRTYPDTGSLGITKDCGSPEQSEHKEGRAFDWAVSVRNAHQVGEVNTVITWLTRADSRGNQAAMARRLGIMYMIWNHRMWRSYDPRWLPYSGSNPHTDHVHFSFGWSGARKVTSYWDRTVAPIDFGPNPPPHATPVQRLSNLALVHTYGGTTLAIHARGTAVALMQRALRVVPADGDFGAETGAAVARFQADQRLPLTQRFGPVEWHRLFPPPVTPVGALDPTRSALGKLLISGWAFDPDVNSPVDVSATLDGTPLGTVSASGDRPDVAASYPDYGSAHGFAFTTTTTEGPHTLCVVLHNLVGTPGTDTALPCASVSFTHAPEGALEQVAQHLDTVTVSGWAVDPDVVDPVALTMTVDGATSTASLSPVTRTDVGARYPGLGDDHGFSGQLSLAAGPHTVCVTAANAPSTPGADAALGCRTVLVQHSPVGAVTQARRGPGGVQVTGWGLDPDVAGPIAVDLLSDSAVVASTTANAWQPGIAATYPDQGGYHGFAQLLALPAGTHTVCARLTNASTAGADVTLPCSTVVVSNQPTGVLTAVRTVPGGSVVVSGYAYDPDTAAAVTVQPTLDGRPLAPLTANLGSTAAAVRWPGYGARHGFAARYTPSRGVHVICVRAANAAGTPGVAQLLGCRTVVVHDGNGSISSTSLLAGRTLVVRGWAIDPDTTAATTVRVLVDGVTRTGGAATLYRAGFTTAQPGYGPNHGFRLAVALPRGRHRVCVVVQNVRGTLGASRQVACRTITA